MVIIRLWYIFFVFFKVVFKISASTHWVVTENGRIQSHLDSPFYLRRPYDLLALLDQETRRTNINTLYQDLVSRKSAIDEKWSSLEDASNLEQRIYSQDSDCLRAGKLLSDIDLYPSIASNGSERVGIDFEFSDESIAIEETDYLVPECGKFTNLDFSLSMFEQLPAMINRATVSFEPEEGLEQFMPFSSVDYFGHLITKGLAKNGSSWLHHNLASLYWRIKGDAPNAIECARRAVYFSPKEFRDIPLLNLANTFHQGKHPSEAAIILHAAIDHAPLQPMNYYALGNVYTVLTEYNRSVACYNNFLKLQADVEEVVTVKHAVLCHQKLLDELIELHKSLQGILSDLHDYHSQQQQWVRHQERFLWEQAPFEVQLAGYDAEKLSALVSKKGQRCIQRNSDNSKPVITCDFTDDHIATDFEVDIILNLQRILQNVKSETERITEHMRKRDVVKEKKKKVVKLKAAAKEEKINPEEVKEDESKMPPVLHQKFPVNLATSGDQYFDAMEWPKKEECEKWNLPIKERDELDVPVFLPPENKGYQIHKMLSDYIELPQGSEHELPWYPPVCEYPDAKDDRPHLPNMLKETENTPLKVNDFLREYLMGYVNNGNVEEAEIGQRIVTAMRKKTGPSWLLATLASLYWRVRSNTRRSLECLEAAFQTVPKDQIDVVLVSYASVLHQHGMIEDAIQFAMLAFKVNYVEPSTNFLLALLQYEKSNPILAMYYMKNALRVDSSYYSGKAEMLLKTWACRIKLGGYEDLRKEKKSDLCRDGEREAFNGEGVVCSANGEQCKTATIQCVRGESVAKNADSILGNLKTVPSLLSTQHCNKYQSHSDRSVISSLLNSESLGEAEPDQSQLERLVDGKAFHMRMSLDDENAAYQTHSFGDFYVSAPLTYNGAPEVMLHVFDKSGTYPLSPESCKKIGVIDAAFLVQVYQPFVKRNIDISSLLNHLPKETVKDDLTPYCTRYSLPSSSDMLDQLTAMILKLQLPNAPETYLVTWLSLMTGDQKSTLKQLGAKIAFALQENTTSWMLATAAALYWRVLGNTQEAVVCVRQALAYVPSDLKDVALVHLAGILHNVGLWENALEVAYVALESNAEFVVNHFLIANIHATLGDFEKAISYYRSSLVVDADFEPARRRLKAMLCMLLFDEVGGSVKDETEN